MKEDGVELPMSFCVFDKHKLYQKGQFDLTLKILGIKFKLHSW